MAKCQDGARGTSDDSFGNAPVCSIVFAGIGPSGEDNHVTVFVPSDMHDGVDDFSKMNSECQAGVSSQTLHPVKLMPDLVEVFSIRDPLIPSDLRWIAVDGINNMEDDQKRRFIPCK